MNQLRSFASSSGDRPSIFFSSFSTSVIDSFRVFGRWYFTPCYPPTKGRNDGQSLLDRLLPLDQEPRCARGLREDRGARSAGGGRALSGARQPREGVRSRAQSAHGGDRVRQRAKGDRGARRRRLPGVVESAGRRGQARHADRRGRGLKPPRRTTPPPSAAPLLFKEGKKN